MSEVREAGRKRGIALRTSVGVAAQQAAAALLLFLPAGTVRYWEAWVYWALFTLTAALGARYFVKRDPDLVARRLAVGPTAERRGLQKVLSALVVLLFCAVFVAAGLERRFHAVRAPVPLVLAADALVAAAYGFLILVFRENRYAAGNVGVAAGQQVISTGPYARVRHPMYAGDLVLLLATPAALGSWWALGPAVLLCGAIVVRLLDEERCLSQSLPGYDEYRRKVRYRLIPRIW